MAHTSAKQAKKNLVKELREETCLQNGKFDYVWRAER